MRETSGHHARDRASLATEPSRLGPLGWLGARVQRRPLDALALLTASALAAAIMVNALALQDGRPGGPRFEERRRVGHPAARPASPPSSQPADFGPGATQSIRSAGADRESLVRDIQAELVRRRLYDGPADGVLGPRTEAAIRSFQTAAGVAVQGEATQQLLAQLRKPAAPAPRMAGNGTPRVLAVQRVLSEQGFGPVKTDGVFGDSTRAAIRRFEQSRGLAQRGEITPQLLRQLTAVSGTPLE